MKKLAVFVCLILSGCYAGPKYYDSEQYIKVRVPKDTTLNLNGSEVKTEKIKLNRSFFSENAVLSKKGFEDKEFKIKSHWTSDKWAEKYELYTYDHPVRSGWYMLPPTNTIYQVSESISVEPLALPYSLIVGLVGDIANLVYGIPSVIIANPWYQYDEIVDLTKEILIPTLVFKQQCHAKKKSFIGNNDCLSCSIETTVLSTQEECNRCSNRKWIDGYEPKENKIVKSECRLK
ncbi:MAG: hypothetical protein IKS41_05710 [Alphaproteobacteria bacterium]|nr:hypothetical protein [Alphaproteobacteria bacterium]